MNNSYTYREDFKIRSSEVGPDGKMKLQSVCDLLQEIAGNHALKLNFDISQLQDNNLTWILHRLHIRMDRYPSWRDIITIETWPSSGDTLRAYRDFLLFDEEGAEIGRALSYWLMFDISSRRPVRMPREILDMAPADTSHVMELKNSRLSKFSKPDTSRSFRVRRSDLDVNRHVNNVKYVEWALETLPEDHVIREMDIEFHAECVYGDTISSEITEQESPPGYRHQIKREHDDKVVALAQSRLTSA